MSHESADSETAALLRAIGKVRAPEPRVLEDAREALWSVVAREVLGLGPAGEARTWSGGEDADSRMARRRQAGRSRDGRKTAMGGEDPQA
jgi:hypothetical protein